MRIVGRAIRHVCLHRNIARAACVLLLGCVEAPTGVPPTPSLSLWITPGDGPQVLAPGTTLRLIVEGIDAQGYFTRPPPITWTSLDPAIATVGKVGLVRGKSPGNTRLRAVGGGLSAEWPIRVRHAMCSGTTVRGPLAQNAEFQGTIGVEDCGFDDGTVGEGWTLSPAAPTSVLLELVGGTAEHTLLVTNASMQVDPGDTAWVHGDPLFYLRPFGLRAMRTLAAGNHRVWVLDRGTNTSGPYTLRTRLVTPCSAVSAATSLGDSTTTTANLTVSECVLPDGAYADGWSHTGGGMLAVDVSSAEFAPRVVVSTAAMARVQPTYFGHADSVRHAAVFILGAGEHRAWVHSVDSLLQQQGSYALRARTVPTCDVSIAAATEIAVGTTVVDSIAMNDCFERVGDVARPADYWRFTLSVPTTLRLDLTAPEDFPPYFGPGMTIRNAVGMQLVEGTASRPAPGLLRFEHAFAAGTYRILVSAEGSMFPYSLSALVLP